MVTVNSRLEELKRIEGENPGISELVESKYIRHPKEYPTV